MASSSLLVVLLSPRCGPTRVLHSFPTRRSSDLRSSVEPRPDTSPERPSAPHRRPGPREDVPRGCAHGGGGPGRVVRGRDRKTTRLNSSHRCISYAVFCLKKKKETSRCQTTAHTP